MSLLEPPERELLANASRLAFCNPFLPEWVELERRILGPEFVEADAVWSLRAGDPPGPRESSTRITRRVERLLDELALRLERGSRPAAAERALVQDGVLWLLYHSYEERLYHAMLAALDGETSPESFDFFRDFRHQHLTRLQGIGSVPSESDSAHLFACFFQVRRAFHHIFRHIIGGSMAAAGLRAAAWQSVFSHDMRRYRRSLYEKMGEFSTLITGPSGTGKELVAQAIGLSRYVPFDPKRGQFSAEFAGSFYALNLSAMAPTLIESELFGHRRGAFTGALQDRAGWLEICPPLGSVFLDEIGDLDPALQVKLLRVIETRTFQRLGDTADREFHGKLVAATHRDLSQGMQEGSFREDLYYRLCSDLVRTPSLREQLDQSPGVLRELLLHLAARVVDEGAAELAEEVASWVDQNLGPDYPWPGNIRELEQCLRNVLVRRHYQPPAMTTTVEGELLRGFSEGSMGAEQLLGAYCTWVYHRAGSYQEAGRRLGLDRRTVKAKIDRDLLERLSR